MANETLHKIEYQNIEQFLEDINRNFGIVQNSPLFMGVPGKGGAPGIDGPEGFRGSNFLFVNVNKFNEQFENEISLGNQIDIHYLNNKLSNFESKNKLLEALDVSQLVNKDVIVLTNSMMLSFNGDDNILEDTGQAFNPEANFLNGIQQTIETYVKNYVDNHPSITGIKNIFTNYATLAKNYADNNSAFISDSLLNSSVYSPYLPGFNNNVGVSIENHKYFGYSNEELPISLNNTLVQGSIRRYYQLLMGTISTDSNQTLTNEYAPGVDNIPSLVLLQDTYKNGLYFGYKGKQNLKSFGSMFKNQQNEVVIKSDSSTKVNEFSELLIHAQYLKYGKLAQFLADVEISRNLKVFGDIQHNLVKTGSLINTPSNPINIHQLDLGNEHVNGITRLLSKNIWLTDYKSNVLVTDPTGKVSHDYSLLTSLLPEASIPNLNLITFSESINSSKEIVTANYLYYLIRKVNAISQYATDNYWRKNQFETGEIPSLKLNNWLEVTNKFIAGGIFNVDKTTSTVTSTAVNTLIKSDNINFEAFKNNVLVTDINGKILKNFSVENTQTNMSINPIDGTILNYQLLMNPTNKILTSEYFNRLLSLIVGIGSFNSNNYWRKNQFETGEIPGIKLNRLLHVTPTQNLDVNLGDKFKVTNQLSTLSSLVNQIDNKMKLSNYQNNVLITENDGTVSNEYTLINDNFSSTLSYSVNPINNQVYQQLVFSYPVVNAPEKRIPTYKVLISIFDAISKLNLLVRNNFWRKDQYFTGEIPDLWLSNNLLADGNNIELGQVVDRNLIIGGDTTLIGTYGGETVIKGASIVFQPANGQVLVTDSIGKLRYDIWIESKMPKHFYYDNSGQYLAGESNNDISTAPIYNDYWKNPAGFNELDNAVKNSIPFEEKTLITGKHFRWIYSMFAGLKKHLKDDFYTKIQINNLIGEQIPIGSIIPFDGNVNTLDNKWVVCDGRSYVDASGTQRISPDLRNKFLMGGNTAGALGGTNSKVLTESEMPPHSHRTLMGSSGSHSHTYERDVFWQPSGGNNTFKISGGGGNFSVNQSRTTNSSGNHSHSLTVYNTGGGQAFDNRPSFFTVIYIKKIR